MTLLAIETATPALGCALWADGGPVASFSLVAGRRHAEVLMPAVDHILSVAGLTVADLEAVAVDCGPGLFTGLRVGISTAGALSQALGLPCAAVNSLDVLAHPHRRRPGLVAAMVDARRGEVYWALYQSDGVAIGPLMRPAVDAPGQVADYLSSLDQPPLAVGDGAWRYRGLLAEACVEFAAPGEMWPRAEVVGELGAVEVEAGRTGVGTPVPLYLRHADVRIGWDQVGGRVGQ